MQIVEVLKNKNVKVIEIPKWGTYLRKMWEEKFADHMSIEEKKAIFLYDDDGACGFLWHLFSYEKRSCFVGEEADQAFNYEKKKSCYIFYQHSDFAIIIEEADTVNASDFMNEFDIYITDKEFSWTYVRTHETGWCGPYFSRRI
jgi:hypothetical protein